MSKELMERIKFGSDADAAFAELVSKWQGRLLVFARRAVRDRCVAEDIAQEAFMRVWRCRHGYNERGKFDEWLWRITRNCIVDSARSGRVDPVRTAERDGGGEAVTKSLQAEMDDPLDALVHREQIEDVMSHVSRLSQQSSFVAEQMNTLMAICDGTDASELAESTGVSLPTIKSRKRLAIEKLELALESSTIVELLN